MGADVIRCVVYIFGQNSAQLLQPLLALRLVSADEAAIDELCGAIDKFMK